MSSRIWYTLYDARTRDPLSNASPAYLLRAGIKDVQDVKAAIHARDVRDYQLYSGVCSDDLVVFRDMDEYYDPKIEPLELTDTAEGLGEDKEHPLVAFVPFPAPGLQFDWTPSEARFELPIRAEVGMLELPPECTSGSGLRRSGEPKTLFCRPQVLEQWKEIYRCCIRTYALLWIVGPPGTGKSCAALAFAYALRPAQWDVVWIHLSRNNNDSCCVWLRGNERTTRTLSTRNLECELALVLSSASSDKKIIVFLDGYVKTMRGGKVATICIQWRRQNVYKRRLVFISPMSALDHDYLCEDFDNISEARDYSEEKKESSDDDTARDFESELRTALEHDNRPVYAEMKFEVVSWSFEDYTQAAQDADFFNKVRDMFPHSDDASATAESRLQLVKDKYFVAGGSAELMFGLSTEKAVKKLEDIYRDVSDVDALSLGMTGGSSARAVNHLQGLYRRMDGSYDTPVISAFVVRKIDSDHGFAMLERLANLCGVNPPMDGWIFERWFIKKLTNEGIHYEVKDQLLRGGTWGPSPATYVNPASIGIPLDRPTWMVPILWNEAGYDAVFVDTSEKLVRFVQVTRSDRHSYEHQYFLQLLDRLARHPHIQDVQLEVELYFVVPKGTNFRSPVNSADFKTHVVDMASSTTAPSGGTRSHGCDPVFRYCEAEVKTVEVDYKTTNYTHSEGDPVS